jgi:hypothetical protein
LVVCTGFVEILLYFFIGILFIPIYLHGQGGSRVEARRRRRRRIRSVVVVGRG